MVLNGNSINSELNSTLWSDVENLKNAFSSCLMTVFVRMFFALLVTTISALAVVYFSPLRIFIYSNNIVFYGLLISELALVIAISFCINKISITSANALFFLYAVLNGFTMSCIFFVYDLGVIYSAFGISSLMFLAMAGYGALTHRDLSSIGSVCIMGLIGIIMASIFNFFIRSELMDYIICYIGVLVFVGLTAYDTQRIKNMLAEAKETNQEDAIKKISVIGALTLYLDFINLFLKILQIMGRKR